MNPLIVFWIPVALRIGLVFSTAVVAGYYWGIVWFAFTLCLGLSVLIGLQLHYLYRLSVWLDKPASNQLPEGFGAWTDVFGRLYELRLEDEKNQLKLSEWLARFRQAMTLLPDGVVIMDDVLLLDWCNPAAEQHWGLDFNKDKNMRVTNLIRSPEFLDYIILGRFDQPVTITHRNRQLVLHIIQFENRRQILVTHDITERERIDMMRRDFIANASHELRTPLTVINGFLEINEMQPDLDQQTRIEHIKLMQEQGHRMQCLIDDMLTLTRLESVDFPIRPEHVDMTKLLEQVVAEFHGLSRGAHTLTFINDGPDVMGSAKELHSAFSNLVSNAVRYTPQGGHIAIKWSNDEAGPKFMVHDNGIGISSEHLSRLTERFYRVDKSSSRANRGTGLGLAIVKHVLLRHEAQLLIDSSVGVGSTFSIQFPESAGAI